MDHLIPAQFSIEGINRTFNGVHKPEVKWKGSACPYFDRETAEALGDALNSLRGVEAGEPGHFFWEGDVLMENRECKDGLNQWPPCRALDNLYPFGAFSYTWEVSETSPHLELKDVAGTVSVTDSVVSALNYIRSFHPQVTKVMVDLMGRWIFMDEDYCAVSFSKKVEVDVLEQMVDGLGGCLLAAFHVIPKQAE